MAAIIAAGFFGEDLMNIFASGGEVVGQWIFWVMVMVDQVGEDRRVGCGSRHFATRNCRQVMLVSHVFADF